ncbi:hypothetical protein [Fibrobacter sp.]|uniref:hypothetical protein n=1 Tax=Fibrobacter sp. TaxID=35828 RepID=UPI0038902446
MLFGVAVLPLFSFAANSAPTITPVIPQQDAADNCYKIGTAAELYGFAKMVNEGDGNYVCGKLTADICVNACGEGESVLNADGTLNGDGSNFIPWTPIGLCSDGETHDEILFRGEFHGQGHTISGLYFNDPTKSCIGLIGAAAGYSAVVTVDNVGLLDSYFMGNEVVGGLVGTAENLTITNSYNMGAVSGTKEVGGLVGNSWLGLTITNSYNRGAVSGYWYIGGLAGFGGESVVSGSYNMGAVSGTEIVGGLVGGVWADGDDNDLEVINSYNVGVVTGLDEGCFDVGGLVGKVESSGTTVVRGSYNTGEVANDYHCHYVGGLVGENDGLLIIRSSYNEGYVGGENNYVLGGLVGYAKDSLNVFNSYNTGVLEGGGPLGFFAVGGKISIANSYSMGGVRSSIIYDEGEYANVAVYDARFVPSGSWNGDYVVGRPMPSYVSIEDFADGTVAKMLRDFCDNKGTKSLCDSNESYIWGQAIGRDDHPTLSGVIGYPLVLHTFDDNVIDSVYNDEKSDLLTPKRKGYTFTGWFANEACANGTSKEACTAVTKIPSGTTGEQHFYARWSMNPPLADGCYEIASADQLYAYATLVNAGETTACGRLTDDIKVNDNVLKDGALNGDGRNFIPWTPIGISSNSFKGTFHGQGHTISGLYFNNSNEDYIGLFGSVQGVNVVIDGVGLLDSYFSGKNYVGGIVGSASKSLTISDSYNTGFVSGKSYVGGIVGGQSGSVVATSSLTIANSYNAGEVSCNTNNAFGPAYVGGIVGGASSLYAELTIHNSYNVGSVNKKMGNAIFGGNSSFGLLIDNVFYLEGSGKVYTGAKSKSVTEFANGSVALLLRGYQESGCTENCINGSVWGQNVGQTTDNDAVPTLSGVLKLGLLAIAKDAAGKESAAIDGASALEVKIPADIHVDYVKFNRTFTPGIMATIVLPFDVPSSALPGNAEFGTLKSVGPNSENGGKWEAVFTTVTELEVHTPYLVRLTSGTSLDFDFGEAGGTIKATEEYDEVSGTMVTVPTSSTSTDEQWELVGTYSYKSWQDGDPGIGSTYGFAGSAEGENVVAGQFVKVGAGAYINPMRVYLQKVTKVNPGLRPSYKASVLASIPEELPESIDVVFVDSDDAADANEVAAGSDSAAEKTTYIGTINTRTGEFKFATDRWFDLQGRYLGNKKPTAKGNYFNKKVIK